MARLRLYLDPTFCSFFKTALGHIIDSAGGDPLRGDAYHPADPLDAEIWQEGHTEHNHEICQQLQELVARKEFGIAEVKCDAGVLVSVVQACSYLRLRIRSALLGAFSDEDLENGRIDPARLSAAVRDAYIVYLGLAHLQEEGVHALR